jgi:hypothetical protein
MQAVRYRRRQPIGQRITLAGDAIRRDRHDLLARVPVPSCTGSPVPRTEDSFDIPVVSGDVRTAIEYAFHHVGTQQSGR